MEHIKLVLHASTRNSIDAILIEFSSVLAGQVTSDEGLRKLQNRSNSLISTLAKLQRFERKPAICGLPRKSVPMNPPFLELNYKLRREIVNLLQKNLDCSIKYTDDLSEKIKKELIAENGRLTKTIRSLLCVSGGYTVIPDKTLLDVSAFASLSSTIAELLASSEDEEKEAPTLKRNRPSQPNPGTAAGQGDNQSSIEELRRELDKRIAEIDGKLTGLQSQLTRELDVNGREKVFTFNLQNVREFFSGSSVKQFSESFFCLSLKWSILACYEKKEGQASDSSKYLQLHLFRENGSCEDKLENQRIKWTCSTTFEIRVLSQSSEASDRIETFDFVFVPPRYTSFGEIEFINYRQLKGGYMKPDGSIDIRVHLKINSFKKYSSVDK